MKVALWGTLLGLAGVVAGITGYFATGVIVKNHAIQALTGGMFIVMVVLVLGLFLVSHFSKKGPDDS